MLPDPTPPGGERFANSRALRQFRPLRFTADGQAVIASFETADTPARQFNRIFGYRVPVAPSARPSLLPTTGQESFGGLPKSADGRRAWLIVLNLRFPLRALNPADADAGTWTVP